MHDRDASQGAPRWVKMTGIAAIALLLFFASLHLIGRRLHGPTLGGHGDDESDSGGAPHRQHQP